MCLKDIWNKLPNHVLKIPKIIFGLCFWEKGMYFLFYTNWIGICPLATASQSQSSSQMKLYECISPPPYFPSFREKFQEKKRKSVSSREWDSLRIILMVLIFNTSICLHCLCTFFLALARKLDCVNKIFLFKCTSSFKMY